MEVQDKQRLSSQALTMLGLLSIVVTAFIAWMVILAIHVPPVVAVAVGLALFCIDAASIAMVWYVVERR